jgi:hypothetical protein
MTNLQTNSNISTAQVSPSADNLPEYADVSAFKRELPYLRSQPGLYFTIIEEHEDSDLVRIRIKPFDSYAMAAYSIAYCQYGFDLGKKAGYKQCEADRLKSLLHPVKPAA